MIPRRLRALLRLTGQRLFSASGLVIRLGFCFGVGALVLLGTQDTDYDTRFALRGPQQIADEIVLIQLSRDDVTWMGGFSNQGSQNMIRSLKEIVETSDSFFWQPRIWEKAVSQALRAKAKAVVVTLFFGDETVRGTMTQGQQTLFAKPNVFWISKADGEGHAISSGLAKADRRNTGVLDLRSDPDGRIRHFLAISNVLPHISLRVENFLANNSIMADDTRLGEPINFQGPSHTFKTIRFSDYIKTQSDTESLNGKIVIFSVSDIPSHQVQTPVGSMSSGELLANILYEFTHNQGIQQFPFWLNLVYLFIVTFITIALVFEYPQSVAFVFLTGISIGVLALSAALFDLKTLWLPAAAPLACMVTTYVVISGYRLSRSEKLTWESERERHYISEVEALKNNFLSLISHDLKNPLAKIQGITDRMLNSVNNLSTEVVTQDLMSIKRTSEELRQYIGSILQLTRVEARDIKLTKEVCDINTIVNDVVERIASQATEKGIEIKENLEPIFSIEVDRTLISEVLLNLVENAIKYSNSGGTIEVTTQERDDNVRVEVSDTGGGIPHEEISKVFGKFYRGTSKNTQSVTGTGLGLYLVKYFIELHGGKVFISSQLGIGTKVGFTLPLEAPEENYADFARSHR